MFIRNNQCQIRWSCFGSGCKFVSFIWVLSPIRHPCWRRQCPCCCSGAGRYLKWTCALFRSKSWRCRQACCRRSATSGSAIGVVSLTMFGPILWAMTEVLFWHRWLLLLHRLYPNAGADEMPVWVRWSLVGSQSLRPSVDVCRVIMVWSAQHHVITMTW